MRPARAGERGRRTLDLPAIPIHGDAIRAAAADPGGRPPIERALGDGEDFELILALAADAAGLVLADPPGGVAITLIGRVTEGEGLFARSTDGSVRPLAPTGFLHAFDG